MADASWLPDPSGAHELRYWNGTSWTEHVSDQGTTGQDPLTTDSRRRSPPPAAARPAASSPRRRRLRAAGAAAPRPPAAS